MFQDVTDLAAAPASYMFAGLHTFRSVYKVYVFLNNAFIDIDTSFEYSYCLRPVYIEEVRFSVRYEG